MDRDKKKPNVKCKHCVCMELSEIKAAQEIAEGRKRMMVDCTWHAGDSQEPDTIPFILQTTYGNPFFTFGEEGSKGCFITVFFKVISIDHETCCAKLELLEPNKPIIDPDTDCVEYDKICKVDFVSKTSECITISLKCFSAIKCFKPSFVSDKAMIEM